MLSYICFYDAQGLATLIYEWRTMLFMLRNEGPVRYFSFHKADIPLTSFSTLFLLVERKSCFNHEAAFSYIYLLKVFYIRIARFSYKCCRLYI